MVSDELQLARLAGQRYAKAYRTIREQERTIREQGFVHIGKRPVGKRADIIEAAKRELEEIAQDTRDAAESLRKRAAEKKVKGTPEARAKVERALSHGFSLSDLCAQLVSEGDRVGLAALQEYLPYAARDKRLPIPHGVNDTSYDHVIKHAQEVIGLFEPKLWDEKEHAIHGELRELEISYGLMESNRKQISTYLDRLGALPETVPPQHTLKTLNRWQGPSPKDPMYSTLHDPTIQPGLEPLATFKNGQYTEV